MFRWSAPEQQQTSRIPRSTHLSSYLNDRTLKPSTRKVGHDDSTHDTVFQTKSGNALILRVHIRDSSPMMTLVGIQATHPWIDTRMRVTGYAPIQSESTWNNSELTLGRAVNAVVKHFQFYPPINIQITNQSLHEIQMRMNQTIQHQKTMGNLGPVNEHPQGTQPVHKFAAVAEVDSDLPRPFAEVLVFNEIDASMHESILSTMHIPPSIPNSFPEVDNMETSQIKHLLHNKPSFQTKLSQLPYVQTMKSIHHSKATEVRNLADDNLTRESDLRTLYDEVQDLQKGLQEKVTSYNKLQERQEELCRPADRRSTVRRLTVAKKDLYNESEGIASDWLEDGTDVNEFIKDFVQKRTVHHVRAAKIERVNDE